MTWKNEHLAKLSAADERFFPSLSEKSERFSGNSLDPSANPSRVLTCRRGGDAANRRRKKAKQIA
jgi:hypothetical protein